MADKERISIFIDGSNLYHGLKSMGIRKINFEEFAKLIAGNRELQRIFYYTAMMDKDLPNIKDFFKNCLLFRNLR